MSVIKFKKGNFKKVFFVTLIIVYSCSKIDTTTIFMISIRDYYSNEPIPDYAIQVSPYTNLQAKTQYFSSDNNGEIKIVMSDDHYNKSHIVEPCQASIEKKPNNYNYYLKAMPGTTYKSGHTYNINLRLKNMFFCSLRIIDSTFLYKYMKLDAYGFFYYKGELKDTIFNKIKLAPEEVIKYTIWLSDDSLFYNQNTKRYDYELYVPKADTFSYNIVI